MADSKIVAATGNSSPLGRGVLGKMVETAMSEAVLDISTRSEEIWADPKLSDEEKARQIAEINSPDAVRAAKENARQVAKKRYAREAERKNRDA